MTRGRWPEKQIDHINGIRDDNRPENLREASNAENQWNSRIKRHNVCGYKGVQIIPSTGRWRARIRTNGHMRHLGCFETAEEAHLAYAEAADRFHGEFSRTA
jgi:hypothetical protein